jgi:hypothetical protein
MSQFVQSKLELDSAKEPNAPSLFSVSAFSSIPNLTQDHEVGALYDQSWKFTILILQWCRTRLASVCENPTGQHKYQFGRPPL